MTNTVSVEFTREEATTVRFLLAGAPHVQNVTPPQRLAAQDALTKVDAALAPPADPAPSPQPELTE